MGAAAAGLVQPAVGSMYAKIVHCNIYVDPGRDPGTVERGEPSTGKPLLGARRDIPP